MSKNNESWAKIYKDLGIKSHNFDKSPFCISAEQIKRCVKDFANLARSINSRESNHKKEKET